MVLEVLYEYKLGTSLNALYMTHWLFLPFQIIPGWLVILLAPPFVIASLHINLAKADLIDSMLPEILGWQETVRQVVVLILVAIRNVPSVLM